MVSPPPAPRTRGGVDISDSTPRYLGTDEIEGMDEMNTEPSPHELEWRALFDEFFRGHEHLWDPLTGRCVAENCPSKKKEEDE